MAPNQRRLVLLVGLIGLLVAVVITQTRGPRSTGNAGTSSNSTTRGQTSRGTDTEAVVVKLDELRAPRPEPVDGERNPFRFGRRPAPPAPSSGASRPTSPPVELAPVAPLPPPGPPPIALKFIGLVEASPQGGKLAVLSDGRSVFHGYEGAIIDGRYRIVRIGVESIELTYADGQGRQTIRLTGQ